nr:acyltransferase family protein [uncultured Holophaga sp.]
MLLSRDPQQVLGLDGARALSVAAVVLYHAGYGWMGGGFLGVELFFVISGFLITGLLLKSETLTFGDFWVRRLRRLLPALLALVLVVEALGVFWLGGASSQFRGDLLASLCYVENWYQIGTGSSYFADAGHPLLRHLWSLSVEAQFYLVWPLVIFLGRRLPGRRWTLVAVLGVLALGSAGLMAFRVDPDNASSVASLESFNRAYLGTDTRASGLLVGAILALLPRPGGARRAGWGWDLAGLGALAGLAAFCCLANPTGATLYRGGFLAVDLLMALVIAALLAPGSRLIRTLLGWGPLEAIGRRSYGIYLWHWPVFRLLAPDLSGWQGLALRLVATLAISELSYRWIETPFRRGGFRGLTSRMGAWGRRAIMACSVGLVSASLAGAAVLIRRPAYVDEIQASIQAGGTALGTGIETTTAPPLLRAPATPESSEPGQGKPQPLPPADPVLEAVPMEGLKVTAIGDSVMKGAALALRTKGDARLGKGGLNIDAEECRSFTRALGVVQACRRTGTLGEVVVIHLGANNSSLEPRQFGRLMDELADRKGVWFVTAKSNKIDAVETVNRELKTLVARYPKAHLYDWCAASEEHPELFYSDRTHLRIEGARFYAREIFSRLASEVKEERLVAPSEAPLKEVAVHPAQVPPPAVKSEVHP